MTFLPSLLSKNLNIKSIKALESLGSKVEIYCQKTGYYPDERTIKRVQGMTMKEVYELEYTR